MARRFAWTLAFAISACVPPPAPACEAGLTECGSGCIDLDVDRLNCGACGNACGTDRVCTDGVCVLRCAPPRLECAGTCVDVRSSTAHCGACGAACVTGEVCRDG